MAVGDTRGTSVWRDEKCIAPGDADWLARLEGGLQRAHAVVCVVGQESAGCTWQQREMLRADELALPVLACRVAAGLQMPLYVIERQPIDLFLPASLAMLADRLRALHHAFAVEHPGPHADAARRARELAHLKALLSGDYSTHEQRYVPVAGDQRRAPTLERSHKGLGAGLRMDTSAVLAAFGRRGAPLPAADAVPVRYADVLDAYRELPARPIRRLAVLGEPGAGKSFSLERIAVDHARRALHDPAAPLPVLVRLGLWTRAGETVQAFVERQLGDLGADFGALVDERRTVLLLDGLNEIPPGHRAAKAAELRRMAEDERHAAVLVSCRERDFQDDFDLPFDRLTLLPLTPPQVLRFLQRAYRLDRGDAEGDELACRRFWSLAGGDAVRDAWTKWLDAGGSWESFWSPNDFMREAAHVLSDNFLSLRRWRRPIQADPRNLLWLASNPYLLTVIALLPELPRNRADLFNGFLQVLHRREQRAREDRHDGASVPAETAWHGALAELAEALQRAAPAAGDAEGAGTSLSRERWPASMTPAMLAFSVDASVLRRSGDDLSFTHQLLQEALASRVIRRAAASGARAATDFWPTTSWWQGSGWEVAAEIAAESCAGDAAALHELVGWVAVAQPEVAALAWKLAGAPALPPGPLAAISRRWAPRQADEATEPEPVARAAIGRALAAFSLDRRPGVGVRADGLPDIDWVPIQGPGTFVYQGRRERAPVAFEIARYPVTNQQFQAFVDAGGYADERWWQDVAKRTDRPADVGWKDSNTPRESVSWYEALAFCRWLSHALSCDVTLPTERQWERAAAGVDGRKYPWGNEFDPRWANSDDHPRVGRTTAVGLYPHPSAEGVYDLAGNVLEWCLDPCESGSSGVRSRVLRGGSWTNSAWHLRAASRSVFHPDLRVNFVGFRVCRSSPLG